MSRDTTAGRIVGELGRALLPLSRLDSAERVAALLAELGWDLPGAGTIDADLGRLGAGVDSLFDSLVALDGAADDEAVVRLLALIVAIEAVVSGLGDLRADVEAALDTGVVDDSGLHEQFVRRLVDHLVTAYLLSAHPGLYALLVVVGLAEQQVRAADPAIHQLAVTLPILHWDRLPLAASDPRALAELALGWGPDLDAAALVDRLDQLVRSIRLPGGLYPQDPAIVAALGRVEPDPQELRIPLSRVGAWPHDYAELGLGVSPLVPGTPGGLGLAVAPYAFGDIGREFDLGGDWTLTITGGADHGVGPAAIVRPASGGPTPTDITVIDDLLAGSGSGGVRFDARLAHESPDGQPTVLFGRDGATRIELERIELAAGFGTGDEGPAVDVELVLGGVGLVVGPAGADSFARALLPAEPFDASCDVVVGWSSATGFRFNAGGRFDIAIPVGRAIGPVTVETFHLAVSSEPAFELTVDLATTLAVFAVTVEGFGVRTALAFPAAGGNLGPVQLEFGIVAPRYVGLELTTEAAHGGGFVAIDPDIGRYAGALSFDFVSIGIDAIVVVDTDVGAVLPGADGWALFASLAASFPGLPLGFGFTLSGVGGLLAINRTIDTEALATGLRAGTIDDLLFPDDPVGGAADLIARIDEYFPLMSGNTVIGPVLEIGWGAPTLITAQLGVVLSVPDGVIAVLGSVEALLPTPEAPLIRLRMDSLGAVDLAAGTMSLNASLYDSKLLETIDLSGDMAMYLQTMGQPYFLLSVGGFHPGFEPPSIVPAAMHDLRTMRAALEVASDVTITVESYFAVTSNSLQFGAAVHVTASVEIWPATYTAKGWFTFDVLLVFSPFKIVAAMSAGVGIYSGERELMGVQLSLHLEGPQPWYAAGTAAFTFFGLKVRFELEVGSTAAGEPPPIAHPRAAVMAAIASPAAWSETTPLDAFGAGITFSTAGAGDGADETVWIRPDRQLTVRQSVAPLNRTLEIVGQAVPAADESRLTVTGAGFTVGGAADWALATDWFAPAQFEVLGRSEKLSRASFEEMAAGVTFGAPGMDVPADRFSTAVTIGYEDGSWQPDPAADEPAGWLAASVRSGAAGVGLRHATTVSTPRFSIAPTAYTVVRTIDGAVASDVLGDADLPTSGVDQRAASGARRRAVAADASRAARLVVVAFAATTEEP